MRRRTDSTSITSA